jgi:glycosyltransferase involved in cell wall biosynthesis
MISTHGDPRIIRTLHSIATQKLIPGDDVLIVGDGPQPWTKQVVETFGPPFRYVFTKATRDWGHTQMNVAINKVGGDYVTGQDHDDIYLPRAFESIREAILLCPGKPLMVRVKTPSLGILWTAPAASPLDGHCLVTPNDKDKIGRFDSEYDGDQRYMSGTVDAWGTVGWVDKVTTLTRPTWKLWPWPVYQRENEWEWEFLDPTQTRKVGSLRLTRMITADGETYMAGDWNPADCERTAWREITEFMLWAAQEQLHIRPHTEEQKRFLWAMSLRSEYDGSLVSYWPPDDQYWEAM